METIVLCDFDGTVTTTDVQQFLMGRFAHRNWLSIDREWERGQIGTEERARRQWSLIHTPEEELLAAVDSVRLDPYFPSFVRYCEEHRIPLHIVSDGFDFYIHRIMQRSGLGHLPVVCNHLSFVKGEPVFNFLRQDPTCDRCGNCKKLVYLSLKRPDNRVVYIGDGISDHCPAEGADVVLAKGKLLSYCREKGIPCTEFSDFGDVMAALRQGLD